MLWILNSSMHNKGVWRESCKQGSPKSRDQHTESKDRRELWNTMFHRSQVWIIQLWSKWEWWLLVRAEWFRWCKRSRWLEGKTRLPSPCNKGIMGRGCSEKHNMKIEKSLFDNWQMNLVIFGPLNVGSKRRKTRKNLLTAMGIPCNS